ncbi:unnamed protein product [Symbiodinium microadriaticum]|nr:unnamed protein product [Symbiodinium microadriaticum]
MLSVQDELTGQSESQPQAYKQKDAISSHSTAGTPASPGVSGREAVDVLQSQEELMRSAAAQSEQEFLQKALEDSLKSASARDDMEEALLESARIASLQGTDLGGGGRIAGRGGGKAQIVGDENDADVQLAIELSQLSEDELLQRTLQESLKQQPQQMPMQYEGALSQRTGAGASTAYSSRGNTGGGNRSMGFPCADSVTIPPPSSLQSDEDAELQEAIRLSMQQQPQQQRITGNNGDGMTDDEIAAAELEAAIQASMREI